jgi:23S rRNA pseudouridine1911/1915/1917 synthase
MKMENVRNVREVSAAGVMVVGPDEEGRRLDRALSRLLPGMGLRGRRRLCGRGLVLINGRPGREARKVRAGDTVEILANGLSPARYEGSDPPRLLARAEHLAALYKPAGMHTVSLAGKTDASLEAMLPEILSPLGEERAARARLLNRLDWATSGLVAAALDAEGADWWLAAQESGRMEKRYLALLEGELPSARTAAGEIRGRVPPAGRRLFTRLEPLAVLPPEAVPALSRAGPAVTLAGCIIRRGARHQIRAHAASAGHPLLGDSRYGARGGVFSEPGEFFFLHHGRFCLPGWSAACPPPWLELLPAEARQAAGRWLEA